MGVKCLNKNLVHQVLKWEHLFVESLEGGQGNNYCMWNEF